MRRRRKKKPYLQGKRKQPQNTLIGDEPSYSLYEREKRDCRRGKGDKRLISDEALEKKKK